MSITARNLLFVSSAEHVVDMLQYGNSENAVYFCLSLESYVECRERQLAVAYPFDLRNLHKGRFVQDGMYLAKGFMNKVAGVVGLSSSETTIFASQFVRSLSMILFDRALAKEAIDSYKPVRVFFARQAYRDIVSGDYSLHNGYFNLMLAVEEVCLDKGIAFVKTGNKPTPEKNRPAWSIRESFLGVLRRLISLRGVLISAREMLMSRGPQTKSHGKPRVLLRGLRGRPQLVGNLETQLSDKGFQVIPNACDNSKGNKIRDLLSTYRQIKRSGLKQTLKELEHIEEDHTHLQRFLTTALKLPKSDDCFIRLETHSMIKYMVKIVRLAMRQAWELGSQQPSLVVHELSAFALVIACKRLGISSIALPHGGVMSAEFAPMVADFNVMPGSIQQAYHNEVAMVSGSQVVCGVPHVEIAMPDESFSVNCLNSDDKKKRTIVMLAKNMGRRRWEYDDYKAYVEMLESILNYTTLIGAAFIIRLHPSGGREATDLYRRIQRDCGFMMRLSIEEPFSAVATMGDLFIATQETTVIAELLTMEKPVLFPIHHLSEFYCCNPLVKELSRCLLSPRTSDELVDQLSRLFEDHEYKDEILRRQRQLIPKLIPMWGNASNRAIADLAANIVNF